MPEAPESALEPEAVSPESPATESDEIATESPEAEAEAEVVPVVADEVLLASVDMARRALLEVTPPETVGSVVGHVAEGVLSARSARDHARERGVEMPITDAVCGVLFEGQPAMEAVQQLLMRDPRPE